MPSIVLANRGEVSCEDRLGTFRGGCDRGRRTTVNSNEGWVMPELEDLNDRVDGVSSYIHNNDCNTQIYYYEEDFEGARKSWRNDNPWVGQEWDNHVYSMKMWHES